MKNDKNYFLKMFKNDGEMTLHLHLDTALHCDIDFGHTWIMMYNDSDCTK